MLSRKTMRYSKDTVYCIFIIIATTITSALYAKSTSIFHPYYYSYDGTIFMHIGQAIKNGSVPYRDIYDIKGPMLWLIEYIGQIIHDGRLGIYLLEILNLNAIAIISYIAARYYLTELQSAISTAIAIAFIIATCRLEHTVEEFTYLYSVAAVCITLKNIKMEKGFCNKRTFFMYGLLAMGAMLIRVIDCVIVGSCIIYAGIVTYRQYGIKNLLVNYGFALIGAILFVLPFVVYFAINNAMKDWLDAAVLFSFRYSEFNKKPLKKSFLAILLLPMIMSLYSILKGNKGLPVLKFIASCICGILYIAVGTTYNHYMTIAVPCIFVSVIQFIIEIKKNRLFINLIFLALFFYSNFTWMYSFASATKYVFETDRQNINLIFAENIKKIIGKEDTDHVYTYYTDPSIPVVNEYFSKSKYFAAQLQWSHDREKKDEIYDDFINGNNTWVIIDRVGMEYGDQRILYYISDKYTQIYQYDDIYLYKKKQRE